jgi:hypothetical protein
MAMWVLIAACLSVLPLVLSHLCQETLIKFIKLVLPHAG